MVKRHAVIVLSATRWISAGCTMDEDILHEHGFSNVEMIGSGTTSNVFSASWPGKRRRAVKIFKERHTESGWHEADVLSQLVGCTVELEKVVETSSGRVILVLEYLPLTLRKAMSTASYLLHGRPGLLLFHQLLTLVDAVHERGRQWQ